MQVIYRVKLHFDCHVAFFDFNNFEQACKFADAAKISNVESHGERVTVTIDLLFKSEIDEESDND